MSPLDFYDQVFVHFLQSIAKVLGVNIFIEYTITMRERLFAAFMFYASFAFVHTILTSDRSMALQSLSMFAMPIEVRVYVNYVLKCIYNIYIFGYFQGMVKLHSCLAYSKGYKTLVDYIHLFYKANSTEHTHSYEILSKRAQLFYVLLKVFAIGLLGASIIFTFYPFIIFWISGKLLPMAPVFLPFVDIETTYGYVITYIFHLTCNVLTLLGFVASDLSFGLFILQYLPMVEVFELRLSQFSNEMSLNPQCAKSFEAHQYFCNIIELHKVMLRYDVRFNHKSILTFYFA